MAIKKLPSPPRQFPKQSAKTDDNQTREIIWSSTLSIREDVQKDCGKYREKSSKSRD
jgi:hypothetical protein